VEFIVLQKEIEAKLGAYHDIYLDQDLLSVKALKRVSVDENRILINIALGYPHQTIKDRLVTELKGLIAPLAGPLPIEINLSSEICAHVGKLGIPGIPNIKNIIVVASGKGGVGKSTVAVNLALALQKEGATVGILDADFYGPSQPTMLGAEGERPALKDKKLQPIERYDIQMMSIGLLVDQQSAMMWRGPMIGKALQQLLYDTNWGALDYLVVDLPPGTGDVQLTLCQKIPVSGAVIVTTPQDLALLDVRRACEMFQKLNVPILGIVENMSVYQCGKCGDTQHIFGKDGASQLAEQYKVPILGKLPLSIDIREKTDRGEPTVVSDACSHHAGLFHTIAKRTAAKLSLQNKDYSAKFPKIVVQTNQT
jgi:ATP-binding protein involved in chromosome partitioning